MGNPNPTRSTWAHKPMAPELDQHPTLAAWVRRRNYSDRAAYVQTCVRMLKDAGNTPRAAMLIMQCLTADMLAARAAKGALALKPEAGSLEAMDEAMDRQREAWAAYDAEVERVRAAADGLLGFDV